MYIVERKIDGIIYKAQFKGIGFSIAINDLMEKKGSSLRVAEILFDEVLVSPRITIDDFDDMETYKKVYDFLYDVASGIGLGKKLSKSKLKQRANDNWALWRLVLSGRGFDYQTVFGKPFMTPQDVNEANVALDMQLEAERQAAKKK